MKKSLFIIGGICLALNTLVFAERAPDYISPNNDGVQDTLVIPLKIKEKRYIKEWKLTIYNMEDKVVRTISNKRAVFDEKLDFVTFFKKIINPKAGVDIPENVVWNGLLGDEAKSLGLVPGEVAPDGQYYYIFSATDDNFNTGISKKYYVIVDNTPPVIKFKDMSDEEKTFGDEKKATIYIDQEGSEEVLWSGAIIYNSDGKKVKNYKWENTSPTPIIWDGTDDEGLLVSDGVYYYEIYATDKAGNTSEKAVVNNIIFSADKPEIKIALKDGKYFSPNGDGVKDFIDFDVTLPVAPTSVNNLKEWKLSILDANNQVCFEKTGGIEGLPSYAYDGKKLDGTVLADGIYKAVLEARYKNGYVPPVSQSPDFVLDTNVPQATVAIDRKVFNNVNKETITQKWVDSKQTFASAETWVGEIKNGKGVSLRTFNFGENVPEKIEWNGTADDGSFAEDGTYIYELTGKDLAGNQCLAKTEEFVLDTSKTELLLSSASNIFTDSGLDFYPTAKATTGIASYKFTISDENKNVVYIIEEKGDVPGTIKWNGKSNDGNIVADGKYFAQISTVANSGTTATSEVLNLLKDTVAPIIAISSTNTSFSPDGLPKEKSPRQSLDVKIEKSSYEENWDVEFKNASGKIIRRMDQNGKNGEMISATDFSWDGKDDSGNIVPDGKYSLIVYSVDAAGNRGESTMGNIVVDKRIPDEYITIANEIVSPNGDGLSDSQLISVKTVLNEGIKSWALDIVDAKTNSVVKTWKGDEGSKIPLSFTWTGKDDGGKSFEGNYFGKINVEYVKGNLVEAVSSVFLVTATPPVLSVESSANPEKGLYFSPDNDGYEDELTMDLFADTLVGVKSWSLVIKDGHSGNVFWKTSGKSMQKIGDDDKHFGVSINWDGQGNAGDLVMSAEDYPYEFTVTDNAGMTSVYKGIVPVDVLVMFDNGRLKMQVPSIIFRGDAADFKLTGEKDDNGKIIARSSLTQAQRDNNIRVLKRVAQILKKFGNYRIIVVGHANPYGEDDEKELKVLSLARATFVKDWLIREEKISASRLSAEGKGGTETIADNNDKSVNWKNRRVEFVLEK